MYVYLCVNFRHENVAWWQLGIMLISPIYMMTPPTILALHLHSHDSWGDIFKKLRKCLLISISNVSIIATNPLILLGALFHHMNHSAIFINDKGIKVIGYFFLIKRVCWIGLKKQAKLKKYLNFKYLEGWRRLKKSYCPQKAKSNKDIIYTQVPQIAKCWGKLVFFR